MAEVKHFIDQSSIQQDADFMKAILTDLMDRLQNINKMKFDLGGLKSFGAAGAQVKQMQVESQKLADLQLKIAKAETEYARAKLNSNKADTEAIRTKKQQLDLDTKIAKEKDNLVKKAEKELNTIEKLNNEYVQLNNRYKDASAASLKRGAELLKEANGNEAVFKSLLKTDQAYLQTTKDAKHYSDQLLTLEQNVGRNQRNVGNYASAYNGLGQSFARIAQELPNAAISFQTFALAISNNLPIAAEQIQLAKEKIAALKAEGQTAPSLFSQITKSIFSFQVGLSIAITLFVLYSKQIGDFFKEIFKGKVKIDELKQSTELLNKAFDDSSVKDATKNIYELKTNVQLAKEGLLDKNKVLKQYNESMGKVTGEVKTLDEAEKALVKNGPAYIRMTLYKAAASLAFEEAGKKLNESIKTQMKDAEEFTSQFDKLGNKLNKMGTLGSSGAKDQADINNEKELAKAAVRSVARKRAKVKESEDEAKLDEEIGAKLQKRAANIASKMGFDLFGDKFDDKDKDKRAEILKKNLEDEAKARREAILAMLEEEAAFQKGIADDENKSFENRIKAAENFYQVQETIANENKDFELAALKAKQAELKLTDDQVIEQRLEIEAKYQAATLKNVRENQDQVKKITIDNAKQIDKERADLFKQQLDRLDAEGEIRKASLEKQRDVELTALHQEANEKEKAMLFEGVSLAKLNAYREKIKEKELEINTRYNRLIIQSELDKVKALIEFEQDPLKKAKLLAQAANIELQLNKLVSDEEIKNIDKRIKKEQELADLKKKLGEEIFNLAKAFTLGRFDAAKNEVQGEIDALDEKKRKEIEVIQATTTNEVEKAARITNAEKKAQVEKERLEFRKRQLDIQRAKFERAFTIASIIQQTAKATIAALGSIPYTPANIGLAALTAAIGAVQIATALATPIPKFRTGKGEYDNYEGPAWVGDGGKKEMIFRKDGTAELTPNISTLTYIGKDDIIHPDADALLNNAFAKQGNIYNYNTSEKNGFVDMTNTLTKELRHVASHVATTIQNKREWNVNLNNGKPSIISKDSSRYKKYLNDNLQFGK